MPIIGRVFALLAVLALGGTACSSPASHANSGPPSCTDTSVSAARLVHGCTHNGKTYKAIVTRCADGRTMYNVPAVPPHGASGFSGGHLRDQAVTVAETEHCVTGSTATP